MATATPPCGQVSSVAVNQITDNSAIVSWDGINVDAYWIQIWTKGGSMSQHEVLVPSTSFELQNLESGTEYRVRVITVCNLDSRLKSDPTNIVLFSTTGLAACETVTAAPNVTPDATSATLSWMSANGAEAYEVQYWQAGATRQTVSESSTATTLTGLVSGITYFVRVRTVCSNQSSDYSPITSFTTTGVNSCNVPTNQGGTSITTNSATLTWSDEGADSYDIYYWQKGGSSFIVTSATNSYTLTDLLASTVYGYRVRSNCNGTRSDWSNIRGFLTAAGTTTVSMSNARIGNVGFNVYPNPSQGIFTIQLSGKNVSVAVYDIAGNCILKKDFRETLQTKLDLSSEKPGVYILKAYIDQEHIIKKLFIQ